MVTSYESRGERVSHILCGDFNIEPQFPSYQLIKEGGLSEKEVRALKGVDYIIWAPSPTPPTQVLYLVFVSCLAYQSPKSGH